MIVSIAEFSLIFVSGVLGSAHCIGMCGGIAASSGSVAKGLLIMLSFGLGTIPVMLVTGAGLSLATIGIRRKLIRVAAVSVVVTGLMTAARGIVFAANGEKTESVQSCPVCPPGSAEIK